MRITLDKKWAYRENPTVEVEILAVDCGGRYPVVSKGSGYGAKTHIITGEIDINLAAPSNLDLVPLQQPPREWWMNEYEDFTYVYADKETAAKYLYKGGKTIRVREVLERE